MAQNSQRIGPEELGTLIDLLSHDMLNSNQATLSYLDLIHSYPGVDQRTKDLAERAASQVKSSSMLLDGIRSLVSSRRPAADGTAGLSEVLTLVGAEVSDMFPHKKVTIDTSKVDPATRVREAQTLHDLFGNLLLNIVQLHTGDEAHIEVRTAPDAGPGPQNVTEFIARKAVLPHGVDEDMFSGTRGKDPSKMSRISGAVFASSIARALGGTMTARILDEQERRGCAFEVSLGEVCQG